MKPMKTLIVEDDRATRLFFETVVRDCGYEPVCFADAESAWESILEENYPLAILDWILPGMTGLELCRRMRNRPQGRESVILVSTVKDKEEDLIAVLKAGADDYLPKPVDSGHLKIRLQVAHGQVHRNLDKIRAEKKLQRVREQIFRTEKLVSLRLMVSGIAHELNNPLQGILGLSQILSRDLNDDALQQDLRVIEGLAQKCKTIVSDLLQFSELEEVDLVEAEMGDLINQFLQFWDSKLKSENLQVIKCFEPGPCRVRVNVSQINQVLFNICQNAVQAMSGGGTLKIHVRPVSLKDQKAVQIQFSDTGVGITKEDLEHVFDPFFTTKEVGMGTGLGLSVCQGIVGQHKGKLSVTSLGPDQGTTVTVLLPANGSTTLLDIEESGFGSLAA